MDDKMMEQQEGMGVDLHRALAVLWKKALLILLVSVIGAVAAFGLTKLLIPPQYEATAMFYVNNSVADSEKPSQSISSSDISAAKNLVDQYLVILDTNATLEEIIAYAGVNYDCETLREKITAAPVNSTAIFSVTVESSSPERAAKIAEAVAYVLPERIAGIIEGSSAIVVDYPVVPKEPSSPNSLQNAMIGFILAFVLAVGIILLKEIFDVTIRTDEDIKRISRYPVLAQIPDMSAGHAGVGYGSAKKNSGKAGNSAKTAPIGERMNFAASESYKLLRTNLQFSIAGDEGCRVIGVSSAASGEGKSLSSVNLAHSLAQLNKRVLLVDCDMRKPTLAEKLRLQKHPGLSNFLVGQHKLDDVIQDCGILQKETSFQVITAGQNPPNPVELLSSSRMTAMLRFMRTKYDYIILDLPPVGEVSDAVAIAEKMDGILLVVRQNHCNRQMLENAVKQFEFVNAKILGVIFNGVAEGKTSGYYKRYGKEYQRNPNHPTDR